MTIIPGKSAFADQGKKPRPRLTCNYRGCTEFRVEGDTFCAEHGEAFRALNRPERPARPVKPPPAPVEAVVQPPPKPCLEPGCPEPRQVLTNGKVLPRCAEHQRAYQRFIWHRQQDAKRPDRQRKPRRDTASPDSPPPTPCPLCHRTPEQAGRWAAKGVYCMTCQPWPLRSKEPA